MAQNNRERYSINDLPDEIPSRPPSTCDTLLFGKLRHWKRITKLEWIFLAISIISILTSLSFTIERLIFKIDPHSADFTFAVLLILNAVFCIFYLLNGLFREDSYDIGVFLFTNIIVMIYIIVNFATTTNPGVYKLARLCVSIPLTLLNVVLGLNVIMKYWKEKHFIFAIMSANEELHNICLNRLFCGTMLMLDLNIHLNLLVLVLKNGTHMDNIEKLILGVGVGFIFAWTLLGYFTLRTEIGCLAFIFWFFCWAGPAYVTYKFIVNAKLGRQNILFPIICISGSMALLIRITLIVSTVFAYRTFGKGYKNRLDSLRSSNQKNKLRDSYIQFPSPDTEYSTIRLPY